MSLPVEKEGLARQGCSSHVVTKYFTILHTMSSQLFVFETVLGDGTRDRGTAGLPYYDMLRLMTHYDVTRIVEAPPGTSRLNIVLPVSISHASVDQQLQGITPALST